MRPKPEHVELGRVWIQNNRDWILAERPTLDALLLKVKIEANAPTFGRASMIRILGEERLNWQPISKRTRDAGLTNDQLKREITRLNSRLNHMNSLVSALTGTVINLTKHFHTPETELLRRVSDQHNSQEEGTDSSTHIG